MLVAATGTKCGALAAAAEALKADGVAFALVHESALMGYSHAVYAARHNEQAMAIAMAGRI